MASKDIVFCGGRRRAYRTAFAERAQKLASRGATDADMAEFFDVDTEMLGRWKRRYLAFREASRTSLL